MVFVSCSGAIEGCKRTTVGCRRGCNNLSILHGKLRSFGIELYARVGLRLRCVSKGTRKHAYVVVDELDRIVTVCIRLDVGCISRISKIQLTRKRHIIWQAIAWYNFRMRNIVAEFVGNKHLRSREFITCFVLKIYRITPCCIRRVNKFSTVIGFIAAYHNRCIRVVGVIVVIAICRFRRIAGARTQI